MTLKTNYILRTLVLATIVFACTYESSAGNHPMPTLDYFRFILSDTNRYPLYERYGDPYTYPNRNTFDLRDTAFIKRNVVYDPVTRQYYVIEKIGDKYYRVPMTFTMQEFLMMQGKKDEADYFRQRANLLIDMNRRNYKPPFNFSNDWVNRIVGTGKIEIRPNGYVDIMAGYQGQNIKNPTLPENARKNGGFDFNMNAQLQVDANIGDKIKLPINYNTQATFDFENQLKLDYQGRDDEIIKTFQAGNVSFTNKGTLIPGAQSLFGVKTQLQFGKLYVTSVFANQRSQRQSAGLQGGSATQFFSLKADEYEENRHFLLAQYFRNNYNNAMRNLPVVQSAVQILRMEVWVTNRTGATTDTRDIVALMDLGEANPYQPIPSNGGLPRNDANILYQTLVNNPDSRNSTLVQSILSAQGLQPVQDFEKTFARKLLPSDFYFNPQIGFVSLNQPLQPDEVLGVAYQYTYNGKVYQVGEFSQDVPPDSTANTQKVLFLKLLKATSQRPSLPIWDLMMKNVYSVGFGQLERQDFKLDILYEEPSLGEKRYLPVDDVVPQYQGMPILTLVNLDRLNNQLDPQPDGVFDYLEGYTVISPQSRVVFPVLEPFGRDLEYVFPTQAERDQYIYYPLYDTIKAIAQTFANLNRYKITGRSKSASVTDYQLGFNIPRGSVTVNAGGRVLVEGVDYEINYDLGTLKIVNPVIISAGLPVDVQYENSGTFGIQQRNYMALRLDYLANKRFSIGGTIVRLGERPFFTKQSYGDDPIRNTMVGVDFDYRNEIPRLTKWLDKLPFYSTHAPSSIAAYGEAAMLIPGHAPQIGKGGEGVIYIDDFEGTRSSIDLRFPLINWTHASTPQKSGLFPEGDFNNNHAYNYNRARTAWYNIEPILQERNNPNNPLRGDVNELSKPEVRQVYQEEIFPQRTTNYGEAILTTFDIAYYPRERGPYNYESRPGRVNANGFLTNPRESWGGMMRNIDQTDFETSNIEFIEFWLQDPFVSKPNSTGGKLYFNLGNISEDVLRDGKRQYENGLPTPGNPNILTDTSVWGRTPKNPLQVTNAFSNEPADRIAQDVGFDGLSDTAEINYFNNYVAQVNANFPGSSFAQQAATDPSNDNFRGYRDGFYDQKNAGILERYKVINNPHGNSPVAEANAQYTSAFTLYPDQEELNRDNTMNEIEEYFQYELDLKPFMTQGTNFITDVREVNARLANGQTRRETWYLFRIPIRGDHVQKIGNNPDLKSIRFIRMFLTGFEDTVVARFGKLELVRNQWRKFNYEVDTTGIYTPLPTNDPTDVNIIAVNLEENDQREPIPYRIPPGIERQEQLSNNNVTLLQNEQSISLQLCNLPLGKSRGIFKTMNLDLRQYGKMSMFIHTESVAGNEVIKDGDLYGVIRIGNDFAANYYEVKIPLKVTLPGTTDSLLIWPEENNLDFDLTELARLKIRRNSSGAPVSKYYKETTADGRVFAIIGNPNLGEVRGMMLGIENTGVELACAETWFNELRLSQLDEEGGWAAMGRVDITLADLGNISLSGNVRSSGFGTLEQRVNERSREDFVQYDLSTNLDVGKLIPKKAAVQIPVYAGISKTQSTPEYDPYDLDIKLDDKISNAPPEKRDSIRNDAVDITTIKTFNLVNVKKLRPEGRKPKVYDISNFDLNYSHIKQERHNPLIENEEVRRTRGAIAYNFAPQPKFIEPLKKLVKSNSKWLQLVKDFNFNYTPSLISLRADVFRQFGAMRSRNVGGPKGVLPETYDKYFTFDRYYNLRWDLTRSITLDFNAINNARVDEPVGRLDTEAKKDTVKKNFWKGGRNTRYHHDVSVTYNFPTAKVPFLDWTQLRGSYTAKYDWIGASILARDLGNTLMNGYTLNLNGDFNFEQLYMKSRLLRGVYSDVPPPAKTVPTKADSTGKKKKVKDPNQLPNVSKFGKIAGRLITSVKRIGIQYTDDYGTLLPGYLDSTRFLGMNFKSGAPGLPFVFGYQPDTTWINDFGRNKGLLTTDTIFNALIQQRYNQRIGVTAQVSPLRDFNIDINIDKTFDKQYSELFKDTSKMDPVGLTRLNPYAMGSFSISYISYQTLFTKFDPNEISETFRRFESNRSILSERLAGKNPYLGGTPIPDPNDPGYYIGYGRYAQDVLIPAFIAAYTDKDPNSVALVKNDNPKLSTNPFSGYIPRPNWLVTYTGLTRIPALAKVFTNFTVRHGYNSTLSMNSFNSGLLFQDPFHIGYPSFIDPISGNYVPYYLVPNITISEAFAPLAEIDMTFTNQLSARFEYRKSRQLSLSLIDYQLAENRSEEFTVGINWRKRGIPFLQNVKIGKKGMKLDNDVTFKFDFSIRDDATANSKLDQNTAFGTAGQKVIRIAPTIDYVFNSRVNLQLFFEQNRVIPKISTSFPVTNTRGGLRIRISLAQ